MKIESRRLGEGTGSVVHCGEQREPKPHQPDAQDDPIAKLRPWESPATLTLRRRLNHAALYSASRATRAQSPHARVIFWIVNEAAGGWTFANANDEKLTDILHGLNLLKCGADNLERNASGA